jgi:hypothetical protein
MLRNPSKAKMGRGPVRSFEVQRQSERAGKAGRRLGSLGCGTEHQGLVDIVKAVNLVGEMQPLLELDADGIQVADVAGGTAENRDLAGLLGGRGKFLLDASVTTPELVMAALTRGKPC